MFNLFGIGRHKRYLFEKIFAAEREIEDHIHRDYFSIILLYYYSPLESASGSKIIKIERSRRSPWRRCWCGAAHVQYNIMRYYYIFVLSCVVRIIYTRASPAVGVFFPTVSRCEHNKNDNILLYYNLFRLIFQWYARNNNNFILLLRLYPYYLILYSTLYIY